MNTRTCKTFVGSMAMTLLAFFFFSCEGEESLNNPLPEDEARRAYVADMTFEGGQPVFGEQPEGTRAYTDVWEDGARLYLQFYNGNSRVDGLAIYDAATDGWTVNYYGTIAKGQESTCEVYYFENPGTVTYDCVTLTPETAVFADKTGKYLYDNGTVNLSAQLIAQTGRLRWKGTAGQKVTYTGLACHTRYDILSNTLSVAPVTGMVQTVAADGYTPYAYGVFSEESAVSDGTEIMNEIMVASGEAFGLGFRKLFDATVLANGKSGFINIPTMESRNGWQLGDMDKVAVAVNNVSFTMVLVPKGSFEMGATSEQTGAYDDEKPAHEVHLAKDYYIGETEVTQALYQAVMGSNPSNFSGPQKPVEKVSWNDCQTFIGKLNSLTGLTFRLPTEAEWEYAARGGENSGLWKYSGSDNIDAVAWYSGNSEDQTHDVKTKAPNELGIYDMSGNVREWCQDWYSNSYYSSSSSTDPTGPTSGSMRVLRGGGWERVAAYCRVARRNYNTPSYAGNYGGFRLALSGSH